MAIPIDSRRRDVVPRWHRSTMAAARGELGSIRGRALEPAERDIDLLAERQADWETHRTLAHASDFVGTALVLGRSASAKHAASFILSAGARASEAARALASRVLDPMGRIALANEPDTVSVDAKGVHARIRRLREAVRRGPRNPIAWSDLAYEYVLLGQTRKALQAMRIAVGLAPDSRFLLRSAARLFIHADEAEEALRLLRQASGASQDPWLVAAEIAVASFADRSPRLVRAGRNLLAGDFDARHITELASALGTLECVAGKTRSGRHLFQRSLLKPSENAVAQAEWASRQMSLGLPVSEHLHVPGSFEARARDELRSGIFDGAFSNGKLWLRDQAFASEPATFCSYVASVALDEYQEAAEIAKFGLVTNPNAWLLLNNLAFAEASRGNLAQARQSLDRIPRNPADRAQTAVVNATEGLIFFRAGEIERGRGLYQGTLDYFKRVKYALGAALAASFLCREELLAGEHDAAKRHLAEARDLAQKAGTPDVASLLARVEATGKKLGAF